MEIKDNTQNNCSDNAYANPFANESLISNNDKNNNEKNGNNNEYNRDNFIKNGIDRNKNNSDKNNDYYSKNYNNDLKSKSDNNLVKMVKKNVKANTNNSRDINNSSKNTYNININSKMNNNMNNNVNNNIKYSINSNNTINNNNNNNNKNSSNQKAKEIKNKHKMYSIKETSTHIYVENTKKVLLLGIEKSFNKIYLVKEFSDILNLNLMKTYQVDSILGIIDINKNNKYLLVVSSSQLVANVLGVDIYNILNVDCIQITPFNETEHEQKRITYIKKLFQCKNFYYSNEIDLSCHLFTKNKKQTQAINDYCINSSLLKYFFDNSIPNDFYSKVIYGYVGLKKNIEINNNSNNVILMDNLIVERVNKHFNYSNDIQNQIKQIEFICIYKRNNLNLNENKNNGNKNNKEKYNTNIFSFIFYVSNEIANDNIAFNPWNNFIMKELSQYINIVCIINNNINININININNNINLNNDKIRDIIYKTNSLGQKIKLLNFTSDWQKNLYFDSNNNSNNFIKSGSNNTNIIQEYIFWFIDINNIHCESDYCFNSIIRIMWKAIQQQIDIMNLGINIGPFNKSNSGNVCNKFKENIMSYHTDLKMNKKNLYRSPIWKNMLKVFDYYFSTKNISNKKANANSVKKQNNKNKNSNDNLNFNKTLNPKSNFQLKNSTFDDNNNDKNNLNVHQNFNNNKNNVNNNKSTISNTINNFNKNNNFNNNDNFNNNNLNNNDKFDNTTKIQNISIQKEKISILCITWNIGGIPSDYTYDIRDLFTNNAFYKNKKSPDIIIIGMQEIVELDLINILSINTNEESVNNWTENLTNTLEDIYPHTYIQSSILHLVGLFCICFTKIDLGDKLKIVDSSIIKTGLFGTLGNKGYVNLSLSYNNILISFAIAHFEAGKGSNQERINTLKQILESKNEFNYQKFKKSDFWFIMGDLNFRVDTSFESAFEMIQNKKYKDLLRCDQFYACCKQKKDFAMITEGEINFAPTYKYVSGSNNYINDAEKVRIPSWTDRILFSNKKDITNLQYKSIPSLMYSDHRPVQGCFEIEIINNNNSHSDNNNNFDSNAYNNFNNNNNKISKINKDDYVNNNNFNNKEDNIIDNFDDYYNNNEKRNNFNNNNDYKNKSTYHSTFEMKDNNINNNKNNYLGKSTIQKNENNSTLGKNNNNINNKSLQKSVNINTNLNFNNGQNNNKEDNKMNEKDSEKNDNDNNNDGENNYGIFNIEKLMKFFN